MQLLLSRCWIAVKDSLKAIHQNYRDCETFHGHALYDYYHVLSGYVLSGYVLSDHVFSDYVLSDYVRYDYGLSDRDHVRLILVRASVLLQYS